MIAQGRGASNHRGSLIGGVESRQRRSVGANAARGRVPAADAVALGRSFMAGIPSRRFLAVGAGLALLLMTVGTTAAAGGSVPGRAIYMPTRGMVEAALHSAKPARPTRSSNLSFHGGNPGVEKGATKTVYLVLWGSQWTTSDPSGEAALLESFFSHVGGTAWNNSVTQYCDGVATGTVTCGSSGHHATNPANLFGTGGIDVIWADNATAAPSSPSQTDLANEAIAAAAHFGNTSASANSATQYVIATATGNNASGFGTSYCAWHSSTSSSYGTIAYTNLPYITDAGASCGANFNGLGPNAGITIVEGHEFAETETDIYPSGGWLDSRGSENGDKCAWNSATSSQPMNGKSFAVQPLWSNASSGCVLSY